MTLLDTFRGSVASRIIRKSELCIHVFNRTCIVRGNTVEVQNPTQRIVNGNSITATLLVLLPSSILSTPACHYASIPTGILRLVVTTVIVLRKFIFTKNCANLKWPNFKSRQSITVCSNACYLAICQEIRLAE